MIDRIPARPGIPCPRGRNFAPRRDPGYVLAMSRIVRTAAISAIAAVAALAAADPPPRNEPRDPTRPLSIDVEVGQTAERDVGIAIGLLCDDLSLIHAELRSGTPESNVLRVTGVRPGDTLCRAGTVPGRPVFVFEIHVTARRTAPP